MNEFIHYIFSPANVIPTAIFAFCVLYWLIVIIGVIDLDMVEKINPFMNEKELDTLIMSHYQNEAQTLTTGAEANLLKLKGLISVITGEEVARWSAIKEEFVEMQKLKGYGDTSGEMIQVIRKMGDINKSLTNLGKDEISDDHIVELKSITEGVRAISKVMIENRKSKGNSKEEE